MQILYLSIILRYLHISIYIVLLRRYISERNITLLTPGLSSDGYIPIVQVTLQGHILYVVHFIVYELDFQFDGVCTQTILFFFFVELKVMLRWSLSVR